MAVTQLDKLMEVVMVLYRMVLLAGAAATLSACGGSTTAQLTTPPLPKPAPAASLLSFESLAANPNSANLSAAGVAPQSSSISTGASNDGNIQIVVGGKTIDLAGSDTSGMPVFSGAQGNTSVDVMQIAKETDALLAFTKVKNGSPSDLAGYSVVGNRTSSADIATLQGAAPPMATFTGTSSLVATRMENATGNTIRDTAEGNLNLFVDFGAQTFDGTMDLVSTTTTGIDNFEISDVNAVITSGLINADGSILAIVDVPMTTTMPNTGNQLGLDMSYSGTLTGGFYGASAAEVGGTFSFTGTEQNEFSGNPLDKVDVQGGFLGKQ